MCKKIIGTLLLVCCSFLSCNELENNSRIAFDIKVIDDANQPIPDIDLNSYAFRESVFIPFILLFEGFEGILGVGSTDDQGEATLISLAPNQELNQIGVLINSNEQSEGTPINEEYGIVIYLLDSTVDVDELVILPEIVLKRSATLEIEIIDAPDVEGNLEYAITFPTRIQQFQFPEGESFTSDTVNGVGIPSSSIIETFETLQNTIALFSYTITLDSGVVESNTIEIPINQDVVQYAFEF